MCTLQSVPVGRPELVQPSLVKQDLGQLSRDVIKYESCGAISQEDRKQWDTDIKDIEKCFGTIQENVGWTLDSIAPVNERSRPVSSDVAVSERVKKYTDLYNKHRPVSLCAVIFCDMPVQ